MANIKYIKVGNQTHTIRDPNASKIYVSSTAPQEGSTGDLWLKTKHILAGEAYAVFDRSDHSLTFFRDVPDKYTNEQVIGTKTYYTGVENTNATFSSPLPWSAKIPGTWKVKFEDIIKPKNCAYWFHDYTTAPLESFISSIENIELLDTSNVTNMAGMFEGCTSLTQLDVSNFDTSNVTNMAGMFEDCRALTQLDLSNFDTSNVTSMSMMFARCANLTTTLTIMKLPTYYTDMCVNASRDSGQLTLKYTAPVTSANIDTLVATKGSGNVVNGGPA